MGEGKTRPEQNANQYCNKLSCRSSEITLAAERGWEPGLNLGIPASGREEVLASVSLIWKDARRGCPPEDLYSRALSLVVWGMYFVLCI